VEDTDGNVRYYHQLQRLYIEPMIVAPKSNGPAIVLHHNRLFQSPDYKLYLLLTVRLYIYILSYMFVDGFEVIYARNMLNGCGYIYR
jgi:hypothetical protein